jgi:hypothetical protein
MMRKAVQYALCLGLMSCATPSKVPPAEQPAPQALDPRLCASVPAEPRLPDDAGLPQPVGDAEQAAATAFLLWVQEALDWGRGLAARAEVARSGC